MALVEKAARRHLTMVGGPPLTMQAASEEHVVVLTAALEQNDYRVRHVSDRTFLYHLGGKIEVTPRVVVRPWPSGPPTPRRP